MTVHAIVAEDLTCLLTTEQWLAELTRFTEVVCVTTRENYRLEKIERQGTTGWEKYQLAGVTLRPLGA